MLLINLMRWSAMIVLSVGLSGIGMAAEPLNEYRRALVEYYGAVNFHPLLLPEGHRVGDVIDIRTLTVLRGQEECFPGLRSETHDNVALPRTHQLENRAASFWVKLKKWLGVELKADDMRQVLLTLEDVSVESASLSVLQANLADACRDLLPVFDGNRLVRIMNRPAVVVSGILKARVNTVFAYSGNVQAEAMLENLAKLLGDAPEKLKALSPEVATEIGLSERVNIVAESEAVQTVAFRPATIFRPRLGVGGRDEIEMEPFDSNNPDHKERLNNLARAWAESPEIRD
jgi:hypothetical protein